jgi:uncharacterized protein
MKKANERASGTVAHSRRNPCERSKTVPNLIMLPRFPVFKQLELADLNEVQRFTSRYAPFSDFNFAGLWSWNVDNSVQLSELNGNLVVRFSDYLTGETFYSLLGDHDLNAAAQQLIDLSDREKLRPRLKLVPEVVAARLDTGIFVVTEDERHSDYILMVNRLCTYKGARFASKRNEVRKFLRACPHAQFRTLDLADAGVVAQSKALFSRWNEQRGAPGEREAAREYKAFERCLGSQDHLQLIGAGLFAMDELIGMSVLEIVDHKYAFTHFEKTDIENFPGIGSFLNQKVAGLLAARGIQYINIEEDLGIAGLRMSKRSYDPCNYLKKFDVRCREAA